MSVLTATKPNLAARMAAQARMLAEVRRRLERSCARAVPGAWQVWQAIYGQHTEGGGR